MTLVISLVLYLSSARLPRFILLTASLRIIYKFFFIVFSVRTIRLWSACNSYITLSVCYIFIYFQSFSSQADLLPYLRGRTWWHLMYLFLPIPQSWVMLTNNISFVCSLQYDMHAERLLPCQELFTNLAKFSPSRKKLVHFF